MKLYTVWTGEYSDRCMVAVFLSEEKAYKYAEVYDKIYGGYNDYYVNEYETEDDKFDINTTANKFYHCSITLKERWNYDNSELWEKEGEITTDELWDGFMSDYLIDNYEDLTLENCKEKILPNENIDDVEDNYAISSEYMADNRESFCVIEKDHDGEPYEVCAYSQRGYAHARKIALDAYYKYKAEKEGLV